MDIKEKQSANRSEYYKKYYAQNKAVLHEKLYRRIECDKCARTVNYQNMKKHQRSMLCQSKYIVLQNNKTVSELQKELDILKGLEQK